MRKGQQAPPRAKKPKRPDVLFIHSNFPGQFGDIAKMLMADGYRCAAIGSKTAPGIPNMPIARWSHDKGTTQGIFPSAIRAEADLIRGRAAAEAAIKLREQGFAPKLIIGHPGWGETVAMRQVFPDARIVLFGEFYYQAQGTDIDFDHEFEPPDFERGFTGYAKNATLAMTYADADAIVCPTQFQANTLPAVFHPKIRIIHEGVNVDAAHPDPDVKFELADGRVLDRSTPVFTHINRHLEPLRGLHPFMRALPDALAEAPDAHAVIIGNESASGYGARPPKGKTWKQVFWEEIEGRVDASRVHFLGRVDHARMLKALQVSAAHVYFTYPFVLSWSLLEAMASECLVLASDTAPLHEVVVDGENGRLLDFFDTRALSTAMVEAALHPERFAEMRKAARRTVVSGYDRTRMGVVAWKALVKEVLA